MRRFAAPLGAALLTAAAMLGVFALGHSSPQAGPPPQRTPSPAFPPPTTRAAEFSEPETETVTVECEVPTVDGGTVMLAGETVTESVTTTEIEARTETSTISVPVEPVTRTETVTTTVTVPGWP